MNPTIVASCAKGTKAIVERAHLHTCTLATMTASAQTTLRLTRLRVFVQQVLQPSRAQQRRIARIDSQATTVEEKIR